MCRLVNGFGLMLRSFAETSFLAECPTVTLLPALPPFGTEDANDRGLRLEAAVFGACDLLAGAACTAAGMACAACVRATPAEAAGACRPNTPSTVASAASSVTAPHRQRRRRPPPGPGLEEGGGSTDPPHARPCAGGSGA